MIDGLHGGLSGLGRLSSARTRSISPENFSGAKGAGGAATEGTGASAARALGRGWKISPSILIQPGENREIASIDEAGCIGHIWMTPTGAWRDLILRFYWDGQEQASVECPLGDFFASGWGQFSPLSSLAVCVNPGSGFNCYWPMPFRHSARIQIENIGPKEAALYYQITYELDEVPSEAAYFHAQFRRVNPLKYGEVVTLLDGVRGRGHYAGTYLAWQVNSTGWWGEGEIKFFLDGDEEFPTLCGTGTEDYFCGSYNFENQSTKQYQEYCTPYAGLSQVIRPDGAYKSQQRFGMYRWHITDPIRFQDDLRVTIQALGWRSGGRYLPLQDDIASTAFWYQSLPTAPFPAFPSPDELEII